MPLASLSVADCPLVRDLGPLAGMPLTTFHAYGTAVTDLRPLRGMSLESCGPPDPHQVTHGLEVLRSMKSLKTIGAVTYGTHQPAAAYWDRFDKGEFKK